MPLTPGQIQENLQEVEVDIPLDIQTGIPKNVKSDKVRSLLNRSNQASQDILELLVSMWDEFDYVIQGFADPNENPPVGDYTFGQLYARVNESTYELMSFWMYTGLPAKNWFEFKDYTPETSKKYYGNIPNPNTGVVPLPPDIVSSLNLFKIGDYYVQTSTGTATGNVLSVWIFLNLHAGNRWLQLKDSESNAVLFSNQNLSTAQIKQVKKNLGWIEINGNLFEHKRKPGNDQSIKAPQAGDIAVNGWIDETRFGKLLVYKSGNPALIASWDIIDELEF